MAVKSMGRCKSILNNMKNLDMTMQLEKKPYWVIEKKESDSRGQKNHLLKIDFCGKEIFVPGVFYEDAVVSYTKDLIIDSWSKSAEKLLGYQEEEIVGGGIDKLIPIGRRREYINLIKRVKQGEIVRNCATSRKHKNGSMIDVAISVLPYYLISGEFFGIIVTYRDLSDKRRRHRRWEISKARWRNGMIQYCRQLELSKQDAEEANRAKTNFLSNLCHEIRTPVNGVLGTLQLLQRTEISPEQERWLSLLQESVNGLLAVMNDLLDISKIESGKMELNYHSFSLRELAIEICNQLMVLCENKGLEMRVSFDPRIRHMVIGDKVKLKQILLNLISNAAKFTEQGYISLEAGLLYEDKERQRIEVRIRDSGIGIAEEDMNRIFHRFVQADLPADKKCMGTGIGLSIAKSLANLMNGDIYVNSKLGEGSTFYFVCDFLQHKEPPKTVKEIRSEAGSENESSGCTGTPPEGKDRAVILSVEDNTINQEIIHAMAQREGYRVLPAGSGEEAMKLLDTARVDLILTDIQMPVMNGYELTRRIRNDSRYKHLPVIAMTAYASEADRRQCIDSGMNEYISKPLEADALYQLCERYTGFHKNF